MSILQGAYINHITTCIYDGFTMLSIISCFHHYAMASLNLIDHHTSFAVNQADGEGVPISFPLGTDGLVVVIAICLGLRFQFNKASLHIGKEVFYSVIH
jgi:hypothetical protein